MVLSRSRLELSCSSSEGIPSHEKACCQSLQKLCVLSIVTGLIADVDVIKEEDGCEELEEKVVVQVVVEGATEQDPKAIRVIAEVELVVVAVDVVDGLFGVEEGVESASCFLG